MNRVEPGSDDGSLTVVNVEAGWSKLASDGPDLSTDIAVRIKRWDGISFTGVEQKESLTYIDSQKTMGTIKDVCGKAQAIPKSFFLDLEDLSVPPVSTMIVTFAKRSEADRVMSKLMESTAEQVKLFRLSIPGSDECPNAFKELFEGEEIHCPFENSRLLVQVEKDRAQPYTRVKDFLQQQPGFQLVQEVDIMKNIDFLPRCSEDFRMTKGDYITYAVYVFATHKDLLAAHEAQRAEFGAESFGLDLSIDMLDTIPWSWTNYPIAATPKGHEQAKSYFRTQQEASVAPWVTCLLMNMLAKQEEMLLQVYERMPKKRLVQVAGRLLYTSPVKTGVHEVDLAGEYINVQGHS